MKIHKLSSDLIAKIAAGEVVERSASAIKELIDNGIDAGANQISIEVLSADGRSFRLVDNGCGIPSNQLELAFEPHTTSKIAEIDDLEHLNTKGFRGEALASISRIAKLTCISKSQKESIAHKISFNVDSKTDRKISVASFSEGTCFEIRDLFFNVPARLKFLKRPETEIQAIIHTVREIALAHPEISFELQNKSKQVFKTSGNSNWKDCLYETGFANKENNFNYLEAEREEAPLMKIEGWIGEIVNSVSDRKAIITFVNQRPINCEIIKKAIRDVYAPFLPSGKYVKAVFRLTVPQNSIDINVHPSKREIRYSHPDYLYRLIRNSLERHLISHISSFPQSNSTDLNPTINQKADNIPEAIEEFNSSFCVEPKTEKPSVQMKELLFGESINQKSFSDNQSTNTKKSSKSILKIQDLEIYKSDEILKNKSSRQDSGLLTDFLIVEGQVWASGKLIGSKKAKDDYLDKLSELLFAIDLESDSEVFIEKTNLFPNRTQSVSNRHIPLKILEEVWERDNWRCVYCGKYLLHPNTVKQNINKLPESWITKLNIQNQNIKIHSLREHQATCDHLLSFSNHSSLSHQTENLFSSCRECNQKKSNSSNLNKWKPTRFDKWSEPLEFEDFKFFHGQKI